MLPFLRHTVDRQKPRHPLTLSSHFHQSFEIRDTVVALSGDTSPKSHPFRTVSVLSLKADHEKPRERRGFEGYVSGIVKNCKKMVEGEGFEPSNS